MRGESSRRKQVQVALPEQTVDGMVYKTVVEVFVIADEPTDSQDNLRGIRSTVNWNLRGRNLSIHRIDGPSDKMRFDNASQVLDAYARAGCNIGVEQVA